VVIIAEYINNNRDSFVNINNFDSEEEGTNLNYLKDNDSDLIIPLSNTPLRTIIKEDKEEDRPIYSPQQKRGLSIRQRIQALY
jgi:hypothetical protein